MKFTFDLLSMKNEFKREFRKVKNYYNLIVKEVSIIVWVLMVLMLIMWSYINNTQNLNKRAQANIYEQVSVIQK